MTKVCEKTQINSGGKFEFRSFRSDKKGKNDVVNTKYIVLFHKLSIFEITNCISKNRVVQPSVKSTMQALNLRVGIANIKM